MTAYQTEQSERVDGLTRELAEAQTKLEEVRGRLSESKRDLEDRKEQSRDWQTQLATLKEEEGQISDQRKGLWREDAKLESTVSNAKNEHRTAENHLASMMDRVSHLAWPAKLELY